MAHAEGIYLGVDYRITAGRTVVDDASVKHLTIHYPPLDNGPRALMAYTGRALLPDGTRTGDWLRETLRGGTESFDQSMTHLRSRLDRDFAPLRTPLIVVVCVVHGDRMYSGGISNVFTTPAGPRVRPAFAYRLEELAGPRVFWSGSGGEAANAPAEMAALEKFSDIWPQRPIDFINLIAGANRRIATKSRGVSGHCHVAFIPSSRCKKATFGPQSRVYTEPGESVPFEHPFISTGIDLNGMMTRIAENSRRLWAGETDEMPDIDTAAFVQEQVRRP